MDAYSLLLAITATNVIDLPADKIEKGYRNFVLDSQDVLALHAWEGRVTPASHGLHRATGLTN